MRLLICAGGTGGGVNPALAVHEALVKLVEARPNDLHTLWVGGEGGMEADLVKQANIPFTSVPAAGLHGVGARALPGNLWRLGRGFVAARQVLRDFQPEVLFFTGGYVAVPVALAARVPARGRLRPASVLYVPDIEPGLALKTISHLADHVTTTVEDTRPFLPRGVASTITGYPVRSELRVWDRQEAYQTLRLRADLPTLLVVGGSRGARSINRAILRLLPELLDSMQIVHASGQLDWPEVEQARATLVPHLAERYRAYPYLHAELGAALTLADLVVSRAGASTLGELPLFGLPAILVPYPYAWRYQRVNAQYLVERGAAVMLNEAHGDLSDQLRPLVLGLMLAPERRQQMAAAMRSLAQPDAAQAIARVLQALATGRQPQSQQRM